MKLFNTHSSSLNTNKATLFLKNALLFIFVSQSGYAQVEKPAFGISASSSITASGFGTLYSPGAFYKRGNKLVEMGMIIQKRKLNLSGIRMSYEYTVFDGAKCPEYDNERLELYFHVTAMYHNSAYLSNAYLRLEKQVSPESTIKFNSLKYSAAEAYGGFGRRIKMTDKLKWSNYVGVGGWYSFSGEKKTGREYKGPGLFVGTRLTYQF